MSPLPPFLGALFVAIDLLAEKPREALADPLGPRSTILAQIHQNVEGLKGLHVLRSKRRTLSLFVLALGCLAMCATSASATKHKPKQSVALLPARSCLGLLTFAEYPEAKEENEPFGPLVAKYPGWDTGSLCGFWNRTLEEEEDPPVGGFPKPRENLGADSLTVWSSLIFNKHPDLLSWHRSAPIFVYRHWVLPGVGTHAAWSVNNEGDKEVWLQVRNDVFTASEFTGGVRQVLQRVAHELSATGK
jgi:hypothetical protein